MHGVNQRERLIPMSVYRKELAKARLGDNIANHMGFIFTAVLYDKFDMTFKQVTNFYSKTVERRKAWQDDDNEEITSESMMEYCQKKKIDVIKWVKSIPMPKKAARIWLKVTDVRVERLQDMDKMDAVKEGIDTRLCINLNHALAKFKKMWNSTIKKSDLSCYGWNANPWVWVIEFERCEKPEGV